MEARSLAAEEKAELVEDAQFEFHPYPQGYEVTPPYPTYSKGVVATGVPRRCKSQNIYVRQCSGSSNAGRILLVQFSTALLQNGRVLGAFDSYYDRLYSHLEGYYRSTDFWELPQWQAHIAQSMPQADHYTVRDPSEAIEFLRSAGYKHIAFSSLNVAVPSILEICKAVPEQSIVVGGYSDMSVYDSFPNVTVYSSVQAFVEAEGLEYRLGYDYRHFSGTRIVPRLTLSEGCWHCCTFCCVPRSVVGKSRVEVMQQVEGICGHLKSSLVYLNDKTFGQSSNHVWLPELYERLCSGNPEFKGFIVQTTASQMQKFTPEFLRASGIRYVELGIESVNDSILRVYKKPASEALITEAACILRDLGIKLIANIMIGLPGETESTYAHTLSWLKKNRDIISHVNAYSLALYADSELGQTLPVLTPADRDENQFEKSWMSDITPHRNFIAQLLQFANEQIDRPSTRESSDDGCQIS